jgi:predicted permease
VDDLAVDWRVLGFALLLALLTTLLVSLAPAWRAGRRGEAGELRGAASGRGAGRLADGLVVGQVALALALCAGSALAGRSLQRLATVDTGFAGEGALTARVSLPAEGRYGSEVGVQAFFRSLQERLATDPRVVAVGAASWLPFVDSPSDWPVEVEGIPAPAWGEDEAPTADYTLVSGDYLQAMGAPLRSGRLLGPGDEGGLRKAVVTASFVRRYLGGREPLGRRLRLAGDPTSYEIVGVVADQRLRGSTATPRQGVFLPLAELRTGAPWLPRTMALVVRGQGEPEALLATTRRVLRELDPLLPLADVRTLSELRRADLAEPRSLVGLLGLFAALGLVLGGVGTFSVAAAWVAHGRRDIGVRMAIGADARRVVGEVLGRGLRLTALGCVLGGVVAWRAALAAGERLLFEVAPSDPVAFGGAALTLLLVGVLATGVPARRASRIEPMRVLREG